MLRTYRRAAGGNEKIKFPAAINASCKSSVCMQKSCKKLHSKPPQTQPGPPPNLPKSRPGASMRAKMRPRVPHERPRGTPEAPKRRPRAPKRRPRTPKRRPRDAREAPRPLQNRAGHAPRCILGTFFAGTSVRKAPGSIFDRFLRRTWTGRHVFRYGFFPYETLVGPCQHCKRACTKKPRKIRGSTLQNPLRTHPKPSKIVPRAPQDVQKTAKTSQNRLRSAPEAPKSEKQRPRMKNSANMAPT